MQHKKYTKDTEQATHYLLPLPKKGGYVFTVSVCLVSVCLLEYWKNYGLIKFFAGAWHGQSNNQLHFGGDPDWHIVLSFIQQMAAMVLAEVCALQADLHIYRVTEQLQTFELAVANSGHQ